MYDTPYNIYNRYFVLSTHELVPCCFSDAEDGGSKKMGGHRSTNSLGRMGEEDEDESPGGGRCITAKSGQGGQGGSPMVGGKPQDSTALRRTSSRDSGGPVVPSSTLTPLSSVGIFKGPSPSDATSLPSISSRVVPADDAVGRAAAPALMPVQHRVVSGDGAMPPPQKQHQPQPLPSMQQQQLQALQQQHRLQQFNRPSGGAGGSQWDDVVGRMTTPQNSGHSLEIGSVDLNSNGSSQPPVKSELDPLLVSSTNSVGTWGSNDSQVALLGPMPPPQSMQPTLRGWSFDSSQVADGSNAGHMVVDLSDVGSLFPGSAEGETNATGTSGATATAAGGVAGSNDCAPGSKASSPDDGAGKQQQQPQQEAGAKWTSDDPLPMEKVVIEPSRTVSFIEHVRYKCCTAVLRILLWAIVTSSRYLFYVV